MTMTMTTVKTLGLVGYKRGMTRLFTPEGVSIPVTVIEVFPNRVTQVKTKEKEGYNAIQVTLGSKRSSRLTKPAVGHFVKSGVEPGLGLWEFSLGQSKPDFTAGSEIKVDLFKVGQKVDISGFTKGKGFQGVIKRHHFSSQDATHGNSLSHRAPGSIGQRQSPGKVFKGKRMAGHLGHAVRTALSQQVVRVDVERNLLLIKGAIPGSTNAYVVIRPAIKVFGEKV